MALSLSFAVVANAQSFVSKSANNNTIAQKVAKKIRYLPYYSYFDNIDFEVNGSTVILSGKVASLGTKSDAENAVEDIDGVTRVINNIENLSPSPFDERIRREALQTFTNRGPGQYFNEIDPDVRIIVEGGRITLEGYVTRKSDSELLNILANGVSNVFGVTNNLVVAKASDR